MVDDALLLLQLLAQACYIFLCLQKVPTGIDEATAAVQKSYTPFSDAACTSLFTNVCLMKSSYPLNFSHKESWETNVHELMHHTAYAHHVGSQVVDHA